MKKITPKVTVIGSANIDLVITTRQQPKMGETVFGKSFHEFLGGKGANQAVAAARLGGDVTFIGSVGKDHYGDLVIENLKKETVHVDNMIIADDVETGTAHITVTDHDNAIVVIQGANHQLSPTHIQALEEIIQTSDVIVLQLEIPVETVASAIRIADQSNIPIVLNPAPATALPKDLLSKVTYITPNETEIEALLDEKLADDNDYESAVKKLLSQGAEHVVLTLGDKGVLHGTAKSDTITHYPSCEIQPVDTTGAGDTFNGAFAVSIALGKSVSESIIFANKAAALSITKLGAQTGMPTTEEVIEFDRTV